jgi:hypothetical protein
VANNKPRVNNLSQSKKRGALAPFFIKLQQIFSYYSGNYAKHLTNANEIETIEKIFLGAGKWRKRNKQQLLS